MAQHLSPWKIQALTGVSEHQIRQILRLWSITGDISQRGIRPGRNHSLTAMNIPYLIGCVNNKLKDSDTYLDDLQDQLEDTCGKRVSIWRSLTRQGFTIKKITRAVAERCAEKRAAFDLHMGISYTPKQLAFVDESSWDRRTSYRGYTWAIKGQRPSRNVVFVRILDETRTGILLRAGKIVGS